VIAYFVTLLLKDFQLFSNNVIFLTVSICSYMFYQSS